MFSVIVITVFVAGLWFFFFRHWASKKSQPVRHYPSWQDDWDGAGEIDAILGVATDTDAVMASAFSVFLSQHADLANAIKAALTQPYFILNVMAPTDRPFIGYELWQDLLSVGLRHGEQQIFHYIEDGKAQFHVAQATEPGLFDPDNIGAFSCRGLSIFMAMKDTQTVPHRLKLLVDTTVQLAQDLKGDVTLDRTSQVIPPADLPFILKLYSA